MIFVYIYTFVYKSIYRGSHGESYTRGHKGIYIVVVVNTRVMRGDRSKVYTIIMDPDLHKNLQRRLIDNISAEAIRQIRKRSRLSVKTLLPLLQQPHQMKVTI